VNTEKINAILKAAEAEDPDITIALLHWGSEDNDSISKTQKSIISLMQKRGVDIIIGTHPHLVQQIDYDAESGNLVAYSLGDFYGDGVKGGTNYSILLDIEITMDNTNRDTRVTNYSITPIYTLKENECDSQRRVVRIQEAMFAYESNYVDRITGAAYSSMQTALKRIEERIKPPVEEED
jgi:poly-gamma-glutamate synthesis protein (capsule biosynthesis protein)